MRISLLLQREPFGAILERTLAQFWTEELEQEVTVHWEGDGLATTCLPTATLQTWLVNSYLNAIFVMDANRAIFDPIRREFSRSPAWWRRPAQQAYVTAALSPFGARWLAQARMQVNPAIPQAQQTLIVAGNHKIRLLDWASRRSYGILKSGFRPLFMQRELAARQQAAELGLSVPRLDAVAEDGAWFAEELVSGTPINRLPRQEQARRAAAEAIRQLHMLHEATLDSIELDRYLGALRQGAMGLAAANHLLTEQDRSVIETAVDALARQVQDHASDERLVTALAHGDFQPGNILLAGEQVWLIDWEYAGRRQAGYDLLVYGLRARFAQGLAQRLRAFVDHGWPDLADFDRLDWPRAARSAVHSRRECGALFLLEELVLHLEENAQPLFTRLGDGLRILMGELTAWTGTGVRA